MIGKQQATSRIQPTIAEGTKCANLAHFQAHIGGVLRRELGTFTPRYNLRKTWWADPEARAALQAWQTHVSRLPRNRKQWTRHEKC